MQPGKGQELQVLFVKNYKDTFLADFYRKYKLFKCASQ